ncbi:MAG: AAA family ATPase, partial [Planctomycetaceae bacterium]|nr:AAA family ATPase [Planctomycetaceae bacterium]
MKVIPTMSKNSELVGVWNGADHIFDNGPDRRCVIGTIRAMDKTVVTIRGYASEAEISEGVTYRFYGHYRVHPKFGRQFNFNSFIEETPVDEDSVIAYLAQCRKPEHGSISKRVAALLFEKYGLDSIDQLIQDPVAAAEGIAQWGAEKAAIASEYLRAQDGTRRCKLDLIRLFDGRRFPKKTAVRAIREFGIEAGKEIRKDPYILMSFPGIGFKGADKLYCDLARESAKTDAEYQKKLADIRRQGFCVVHFVNTESMQSGSTWIIEGVAKASVKRLISGAMANPEEAIEWACGKGLLVRKDGHVASARKALHELEIAEFVSSSDGCAEWPSVETIASFAPADKPLSEHQLDGIFAATRKRVGCLQGSPGVGKTFCVAAIVKAIIREHGRDSIAVAAPTGKAGVRVTQSLAANDVDIQASTIHRLLGVSAQGGDDGWQFVHNEQNPLPHRFLVIDECFVSGTRVCTDSGFTEIQNILPGQSIINAIGKDRVVAVTRKVATHVTKILVGEKEIASSPSHKFFTQRGWVCASDIKPGDSLIQTTTAMRLLRGNDLSKELRRWSCSFLQSQLQREMVDVVPGIQGKTFHRRQSTESWGRQKKVSSVRDERSNLANRANQEPKANEITFMQGKGIKKTKANWTQASRSRRKWQGINQTADNASGPPRGHMDCRVCCERVGANPGLPNLLQIGYCKPDLNDRNRGRWAFAQRNKAEGKRQKERHISVSERVESVSTYESASPELDRYRDEDGFIYLYDLQAERHKSYSVEGFLVHNCSMIDVDLLAALNRACVSTTNILMVGDSNQLAPVGHGRPFFDLQSCIPTGHLTEIRRNSGQIVKACAQIRDSSSISFSREIDLPQENLVLVQADEEDQVAAMESLIQKIAAQHEHDWIEDLQIVTGKNDGSPIARKPLNKVLQKLFNSGGYQVHGNPFRVGDKIVCLKNGAYPDAEEPSEEHFVANGELGRVTDLQPGRMQVHLSDPYRSIRIFHYPVQENESEVADSEDSSRGAVGDWDLGYALSVHRSQGSQWKHVIVMADSKGGLVQNRAWIYTAISRAEVATWVIGHR